MKKQERENNLFDLVETEKAKKLNKINAVRGISFSLKKEECFILLGINGAGKSTTFKCLTANELISGG